MCFSVIKVLKECDRHTPDTSHKHSGLSPASPPLPPASCLYLTALWAREYIAWPRLHPKKRFVEKIFVAGLRLCPVFLPCSLFSLFSPFLWVLFRVHFLHQILIFLKVHRRITWFWQFILFISAPVLWKRRNTSTVDLVILRSSKSF